MNMLDDLYVPLAPGRAEAPPFFTSQTTVVGLDRVGEAPDDVGPISFSASGDAASSGEEPPFSSAVVNVSHVDLDTWVKLDFKAVNATGGAKVFYFVLDVMAYTRDVRLLRSDADRNMIQRQGSGFRLAVAAWSSEVELTADLQCIAAHVELKQATVEIWSSVVGVKTPLIQDLQKFPLYSMARSDFGSNFTAAVSQTAEMLTNFISDERNHDALSPVPVGVSVVGGPSYSSLNIFWSHHLALEGLYHRRSLSDQLGHIQYWWKDVYYERMLIPVMHKVYQEFGVPEGGRPSDDASDLARHMLMKGR